MCKYIVSVSNHLEHKVKLRNYREEGKSLLFNLLCSCGKVFSFDNTISPMISIIYINTYLPIQTIYQSTCLFII